MAREFENICEKLMEFSLDEYPEFATYKGIDNGLGHKLDPFSLESYERREEFYKDLLQRLKFLDWSLFNDVDRTSAEVMEHSLTAAIRGKAYNGHLMPFNILEGADIYFTMYTLSRTKFENVKNYEDYIKRLEAFPRQVEESMNLLQEGLKKGIVSHKCVKDSIAKRLKTAIESEADKLPHFKPFLTFPETFGDAEKKTLYERGIVLMNQSIKESIRKLFIFMEQEYFPSLRTHLSIEFPCGPPGRYQAYLNYFCDTEMTPQEMHELGRREVANLMEQLKQIMIKLKFQGTPKEFVKYVEDRKDLYFEDLKEIKPYCRQLVRDRIKPKLSKLFNEFDDLPYEIIDHFERSTARGMYIAPPLDGSKPATFNLWVSEDMARYEIIPVLLHELIPGHHLQACVIQKNTNLPQFRTVKDDRRYFESPGRIPLFSAYTEGWGLYSEYLGHELGLYDDPIDEYGYLFCNFGRAVRVVVDTGIHAYGWEKEEILSYVEKFAPVATAGALPEIPRFAIWPGQGCSYTYGFLKMKELRAKAEHKLGSQFDIRQFHSEVLECGPVPLPTLEKVIDRYISRVKDSKRM